MQGWSHLELSLTAGGIVYQWIEEPYMEILTQKHSCTTLKGESYKNLLLSSTQ